MIIINRKIITWMDKTKWIRMEIKTNNNKEEEETHLLMSLELELTSISVLY